ncbi:MAG TPA: addiction module protein [Bryobacteraceae bacterium]|nr:addiction module protein [Bryobacteraceae bacterium]
MGVEELESEALKLEPGSRARLAERLLASLDELSDPENTALWAAEARRRDAEMDSDPGCTRPADEVIAQARSRIR